MEDFALASDRTKVLEQLIPGTEDHSYYRCLHLQHQNKLAEVEEILKPWIERHGHTARVEEIRNRQALLGWGKDKKAALDRIRDQLGLRFDHEREVESQKTSYPTALDAALVSRDAFRERAFGYSHASNLSGFKDSALDELLDMDHEGGRRRDLLGRLKRPDHPKLVDRIVEDLKFRHSSGFGSIPIHRLLLEAQLDELARKMPELATNQEWVHEKIKRMRPGPDVDWENDPAQREAYLEKLWRFVGGLSPAFNSLKANVLYHRLDLDRTKGSYDRSRFIEYLKLPRQASYVEPRYLEKRENRDFPAQLSSDYRSVTLLPIVGDDERLVRDHLESFFEKANDWKPFETYVRDSYLKTVFATTKILLGQGDMEQWYALLGDPSGYQALKERVDIELAPQNKRFFRDGDSVSIDAFVKNVPTLVVKVFEINALNHVLATGREPDTSIDLDGLVATEEKTHELPEPPLRRVRRTFAFPSLRKPGVFVIELIGNGKSSRALVKKGRLRFLERIGAAGHVFTILDEQNRHLRDATLWLGGREYRSGENGTIVVPFTSDPRRQPIVLKHGEIATVESFHHWPESYGFTAGIWADRESLLERKEAQVVVRPQLSIEGTPVSGTILEEPHLLVTSTDRHGVSSSKDVPGFELFPDKESVFTFQVPEDLASITFTVTARVQVVSTGTRIDVSDTRTYTLNGIDATDQIECFHLAKTKDGYVLNLLGKTGEARPDRPVTVTFTHEDYVQSHDVMLQTDPAGRIVLGKLPGIAAVAARSPSGVAETWSMSRDACRLPGTIHGKAGESIAIPYMGLAPEASRKWFSLLERSGVSYVRDHASRLSLVGGYLDLRGLPAGDYELFLKETGLPIEIRVTAGTLEHGWALSDARLLETRTAKWLQIVSVTAGEKDIQIRLANASPSVRVHVSGTRYVPAHSIFQDLGQVEILDPRAFVAAKALSAYVSGRDLGDEYRYVLERKFAKKLPGNMLARPGLLLNPWAMRDTDMGVQVAGEGGAYAASPPAPSMRSADRRSGSMTVGLGPRGAFASLDFLAVPSAALLNLRPDERGIVTIPRDEFDRANQITVLALDRENAVTRSIALPECDAPHEDRRLLLGLDPEKHFTEKNETTVLAPGTTLEVADITTSKVESYDTLDRVYGLYSTLSGDATLAQFRFVLEWPRLEPKEKGSRLSEFACHELHFFISRKDRPFFEKVLVPYLANKRAKTFMDHYLLGDDLRSYLEPWAYGRLNVVERILLAERIREEKKAASRHVSDLYSLLPRSVEEEGRLFRTAIQGSALDTGDALGFGAASKDALFASIELAKSMPATVAGGGPGGVPSPMKKPAGRPAAAAPEPQAQRARGAKRKAGESKKEMRRDMDDERAAEAPADAAFEDSPYGEDMEMQDLADRSEVRQLWRKLETTQELGENNYYKRRIEEQGPDLVTVNAFWRDFARHEKGPFLSPHFPQASRNFTEMMLALSVLDLTLGELGKDAAPEVSYERARMKLKPRRDSIVFHREIKPATPTTKPVPVLVSQNYFRADDRYREQDGEQVDKYVEDEMLVHTVYLAQVVLTNPTSSQQKLSILLQIPRGAIPVRNGFRTKGETIQLAPYATQAIEYAFYFPAPGKFLHYPVHVAKDEELVVSAPARTLEVLEHPSKVDRTSWAYVSQHGSSDDVLRFLDENTIERLDLARIAWRLKERKFFDALLPLLAKRHVYHDTLWSYSVHHGDPASLGPYLLHQEHFLRSCGLALESPLVTIDPVLRGWYEHREYAPLVNARAHKLGAKRRILNDRFASQYAQWMQLLCYHARLSDDDLAAVTYYLLLQDRVEEGLATLGRIDPKKIATKLQLDYIRAYAAFFADDPRPARAIAEAHRDHPVDRWRNLFRNVLAQLDEVEGGAASVVDSEDRSQRQGKLAATEAAFELAVENRVVRIDYQNLARARVNYYLMDIELLFSRQPFVQQQSGQFSFVRPNRTDEIDLPPGKATVSFDLPAELHGSNVIVEVVAEGQRKAQAYYAHTLLVQVLETMGELRVARKTTGAPLAKAYAKVYARMRSGEVRFYKDGYTDARGKLDYASLSTDEVAGVDRFAILVLSDDCGAVIREAAPPRR